MPKGRPEELEYLRPANVHGAAKWYRLINYMKERGYSFDLRFSTEVEEFINLLLFASEFQIQDTTCSCMSRHLIFD